MSTVVRIRAGDVEAQAELNDSATAQAIAGALPIEGTANTWGDEIYFSIPVRCDEEQPQAVVQMGDLGYWRPGSAFCIFFGPTPASRGAEIRPASPVNIFGRVVGDPEVFKSVPDGARVVVEAAGQA
jgi:hypothetical protein